ncbi:hypothetical protein L593_02185 [Salinarchaeum sp. Harcht-Bsk1]|nr:hypothetical protein L593_02185 [Salinarchaeum sp. Harcht-Bsk1]
MLFYYESQSQPISLKKDDFAQIVLMRCGRQSLVMEVERRPLRTSLTYSLDVRCNTRVFKRRFSVPFIKQRIKMVKRN